MVRSSVTNYLLSGINKQSKTLFLLSVFAIVHSDPAPSDTCIEIVSVLTLFSLIATCCRCGAGGNCINYNREG